MDSNEGIGEYEYAEDEPQPLTPSKVAQISRDLRNMSVEEKRAVADEMDVSDFQNA